MNELLEKTTWFELLSLEGVVIPMMLIMLTVYGSPHFLGFVRKKFRIGKRYTMVVWSMSGLLILMLSVIPALMAQILIVYWVSFFFVGWMIAVVHQHYVTSNHLWKVFDKKHKSVLAQISLPPFVFFFLIFPLMLSLLPNTLFLSMGIALLGVLILIVEGVKRW